MALVVLKMISMCSSRSASAKGRCRGYYGLGEHILIIVEVIMRIGLILRLESFGWVFITHHTIVAFV